VCTRVHPYVHIFILRSHVLLNSLSMNKIARHTVPLLSQQCAPLLAQKHKTCTCYHGTFINMSHDPALSQQCAPLLAQKHKFLTCYRGAFIDMSNDPAMSQQCAPLLAQKHKTCTCHRGTFIDMSHDPALLQECAPLLPQKLKTSLWTAVTIACCQTGEGGCLRSKTSLEKASGECLRVYMFLCTQLYKFVCVCVHTTVHVSMCVRAGAFVALKLGGISIHTLQHALI
jgi:hypothetical protein